MWSSESKRSPSPIISGEGDIRFMRYVFCSGGECSSPTLEVCREDAKDSVGSSVVLVEAGGKRNGGKCPSNRNVLR